MPDPSDFPDLRDFIAKWQQSSAAELANSQSFLGGLCELLGLSRPNPTTGVDAQDLYVFEKRVIFQDGATTSTGRIDLYKAGCFVLESKQGSEQKAKTAEDELIAKGQGPKRRTGTAVRGTSGWDRAMGRARNQAERYAKALPIEDGWPPFVIVVDVGYCIDLYADFSQAGKAYLPFPDPTGYRIPLGDLAKDETRELLRTIWTNPLSLDPARKSAAVTRELAGRLAKLAKLLEKEHDAEAVSAFLMRCLFTMFAEDIELLAGKSNADGTKQKPFTQLLRDHRETPEVFAGMVESLWQAMDRGGFAPAIAARVRHFNGGLFAETSALPLSKTQIGLLLEAAESQWRNVEPAIFGTLLERALDPVERHKLGAHYTPRAYVERLVLPTVIEPLRAEWDDVHAAATQLEEDGDTAGAAKLVRGFYNQLTHTRILDPACGSGNFLYVTMEQMKRLEGEVAGVLKRLGQTAPLVGVDPGQFLGIEINPRARAIADLVLWIGYIQWHLRSRGIENFGEPILQKLSNIECRDAVLDYDKKVARQDPETGEVLTIWDGRTTKPHPVTGNEVPDETARIPLYDYINPRKASWPECDYIVGNPPFIGKGRIRAALGDGYVDALRTVWRDIPDSADFVMYWWFNAAERVSTGEVRRFGFITTNSISMAFNRRVVDSAISSKKSPLSIVYAIPDHPWVDTVDGAAVRIAMTVGARGVFEGKLCSVESEESLTNENVSVNLSDREGIIHANLAIGAPVAKAASLQANREITSMGVMLAGSGFIIQRADAINIGLGGNLFVDRHVKEYRNGKDVTHLPRNALVIDLYGMTHSEVRRDLPAIYQHILERVKPGRDANRDNAFRKNWWLFGRNRPALRQMIQGIGRYIATVETSKHRYFVFLAEDVLPDHKLIAWGLSDAFHLGVLSSRIHLTWTLATGGTLEDRPVYNKTRCFDPFPFPDATEQQKSRIRELGEALDAHRKARQAEHPTLTMTGMYNVLEKLRSGEALTAKEKAIHEQGLVSVLKQIHDDLDAAVAESYGWPAELSDDEILERLVALNTERAAEEERGLVRWLRPEYQNPGGRRQTQGELIGEDKTTVAATTKSAKTKVKKQPWPKSLPERVRALRGLLSEREPLTVQEIAGRFSRARVDAVEELLETLVDLGQARRVGERYGG